MANVSFTGCTEAAERLAPAPTRIDSIGIAGPDADILISDLIQAVFVHADRIEILNPEEPKPAVEQATARELAEGWAEWMAEDNGIDSLEAN